MVDKEQIKSAYATSHIDHNISLHLYCEHTRLVHPTTSIMCRIGPSTESPEIMAQMMEEGMRIGKIRCERTEDDRSVYEQLVKNMREAVDMVGKKRNMLFPFGIALETRGPEVRLGSLEDDVPVELKTGERVTLTTNKEYENKGSAEILFVNYPKMTYDMEPSFFIFINYGFVKLTVLEVGVDDIVCKIDCGGIIKSFAILNLPSNSIALPALSDTDIEDIKFAAEQKMDFLFASYTRKEETIRQIRDILGDHAPKMLIIACIEDQQGIDNADDIIAEADGIFIARGNLAINLNQEKLFLAQKILTGKCQKAGKPVVTGTQMLISMLQSIHASSAEISTIANAIWEGVDCLVLNDETHHGSSPLECLKVMASVCREAEGTVWQKQIFNEIYSQALPPVDPITAIAIAAVKCSMKIRASAILVTTSTGHSAVWLSRFCPICPIIAITRVGYIARTLQIYKKIYPLHFLSPPLSDWHVDVDARLQFGVTYGKLSGFIQADDPVILVSGWRPGSGYINSIRLIYASGESSRPKKERKPDVQEPVFNSATPENVSVAESEDLSMPTSFGFASDHSAENV